MAKATPAINWATPAGVVAGTPLGAAQLDAMASFVGSQLAGTFVYSPAQGTILPAGNDFLTVTFNPADTTDFKSVSASVAITIAPAPQPNLIVGESPVYVRRKGRKVLTGFSFHFSQGLDMSSAAAPANYEVDAAVIKRVKRKQVRVLRPLTDFVVSYNPAGNDVTLDLTKSESFPKGGQITILNGVTGSSGFSPGGTTVFRITAGGSASCPGDSFSARLLREVLLGERRLNPRGVWIAIRAPATGGTAWRLA